MSSEITPGYDATTAERIIKEYADDTTTAAAPSLTDRESLDCLPSALSLPPF